MKIKCSWCGATWQNDLPLPSSLPKGTVSHGLCKACADKLDKEMDEREAKRYADHVVRLAAAIVRVGDV